MIELYKRKSYKTLQVGVNMDRALKSYAILTAIGMLIVVISGAVVTNTGAANGCGTSWPLCYGDFIPDNADHKTWIEYSHRVLSGTLGIMVAILAVWSWLRLPNVRETKLVAFLAVFFILLQSLLGGAAVIWQQSSFALALHFGFSIMSFSTVVLLAIIILEKLKYNTYYVPAISSSLKKHFYGLAAYTYFVVYTGAFVRHSGSSMGCGTSWPLCRGEWIPQLATPAGVQFIHRVLAGIVFLWTLYLFIKILKSHRAEKPVIYSISLALILVALQVGAGASLVISQLNLSFYYFMPFSSHFISELYVICS